MANFDSYVVDASLEYPPKLGVSLSAANNSFVLSAAPNAQYTVGGVTKYVAGVLYNAVAGTSTATTTLTVISGTFGVNLLVDPKFDNQTVALYFTDRSTLKFTVLTATPNQSLTNSITFDDRGPEERRHFAIEI
jgi:hypothetical protein